MEESLGCFKEALRLKEADPASYSPLVLAYLGDAVYELAIRTLVVNEGNRQVNKMHKESASLVKAGTQMEFLLAIEDELTEEEKSVYRRGRNAKSVTMAKHATMKGYRLRGADRLSVSAGKAGAAGEASGPGPGPPGKMERRGRREAFEKR